MKKNKKYSGIIIPAITPLTSEHKLDEGGVEKIFQYFYKYNCLPFILGTTGESSSLPLSVIEAYVKAAVKKKRPATLLYAGIASNVVNESIEFAKFCADNGVDAVAANLPSYYTLTESQIKKHYELLADACPLPLVIYNIPSTTHMSIPLSIIDELSYHPNIVATKDSERNEERLKQSLELWKDREDFSHFLGWAARSTNALINGSDGLIPSTGNLFPELYSEILKAIESGDHNKGYEMQKLSDIYGNLYQSGKTLGESLWALKVLMKEKGLCDSIVMPPLQPQSKEEELRLIQSMKEIKDKVA
jgi:4-hydroxy-tetrahydrodipicolinate synthase